MNLDALTVVPNTFLSTFPRKAKASLCINVCACIYVCLCVQYGKSLPWNYSSEPVSEEFL